MSDGPPHDLAVEESVLGTVLLSDSVLPKLASVEGLRPEHFYRPRNATIYEQMLKLMAAGEPVDATLVCESLNGDADHDYVHSLASSVIAAGNILTYARKVIELARLREQFFAAREVMQAALGRDKGGVADGLAKLASAEAVNIERRPSRERRQEAVMDIVERGESDAWETPFARVNDLLGGGWRPGMFTVLGGWPSHGKSALVSQVLAHAQGKGARCALYTNEMTSEEVDLREMARVSGVNYMRLVRGTLRDTERQRFVRAVPSLNDTFDIIEAAGMTAEEIAYDIRRERWDLCGLDLLNNLPNATKTEDIDRNVQTLATCTRQARTHIIATQHLSNHRVAGKEYPPEPVPSDLRGSGAIYNLCNVCLFVYLKESESEKGVPSNNAVLKVAKARGGVWGKTETGFVGHHMRFGPKPEEPKQETLAA